MMMLEYDRRWAQCGCLKIECLLRTLSRRMGEGCRPSPVLPGAFFPVKFPAAPVLLADGPQLGSWQVAVVRVDETPVGDTSGRECPHAEQNRQRPSDVSELHGGPGSPCGGDVNLHRSYWKNVRPVVPAGGSPLAGAVNPAGPDGPVVAGGPIGPCETPSPNSCGVLEPLEHSVLIHADPAGQHAAVGMLLPSDCYPAGPAGPYAAGGPVGPDVSSIFLEPLAHSVLIHADPAGQHAAVGTLSPSDCCPAGPAGPYVAGGPVGLMEGMLSLEPLEQSVLNTMLVARPMEEITETDPPERSALASQWDYGQSNLESPVRPMLNIIRMKLRIRI